MGPEVILLILVISIGVILPSILIPVSIYNKKYRNFVLKHSDAIKKLNSINEHYDFIDFKDGAFRNSYDNRNFYENISPRDYLIYQLVYIQKLAFEKMNNADANRKLFEKYKEEVASSCKLNSFDTEELLKNAKKLKRVEKKQFERRFLIPKTEYRIDVCLVLTNINKQYITSKRGVFDSQTIKSLIGRINNKSGEYYLDRGIWDAITRVERGKVSNRLTRSVDGDKQRAIDKEKAVQSVIFSLPDSKKEIECIQLVDKPDIDKLEDISLIFVQRAFIFGGVIGLIAACIVSVFYACTDTSVYLPSTLEKRYKIPAIGAPSMKEFEDNCKSFLSDKKKVGFINADETPAAVKEVFSGKEGDVSLDIRSMKKLISQVGAEDLFNIIPGDFEKIEIPNPTLGEIGESNDTIYSSIRECDGLVIVVKAAAHNGKKIERLLEQLSRQDIKPTAFILVGEDEKLIRAYYK